MPHNELWTGMPFPDLVEKISARVPIVTDPQPDPDKQALSICGIPIIVSKYMPSDKLYLVRILPGIFPAQPAVEILQIFTL